MIYHAGTVISTTFAIADENGNLVPVGQPLEARLQEFSEEAFVKLYQAFNEERSKRQEQYDSLAADRKVKEE